MPESMETLNKNLTAIRAGDADLADTLAETEPLALDWFESKSGPLSASVMIESKKISLASKYDPHKEAEALLKSVDYVKHACIVCLGVGLGYHIARAAKQQKGDGLIVVFEPDLAQFKAVLERIDHTAWLAREHVVVCGPDTDRAALLQKLEKYAGSVTQGAVLVAHPPTRQRHSHAINQFTHAFKEVTSFFRTNVATALVNASRTCYNQSCNLPHYVAGSTVNELHNAASEYPAVCVGAGPSLAKNVHLLQDPTIRKRVIVITAQTTLKPLLDRGIRPDFVTALDYSEISSRFYEGLPDLPDVTLVVEPKGHPAIVDAFPGPVRVTRSQFLERMVGHLRRPITPMRQGATVAHLSFYLAQFLGCDPILFIGQDLGFSDGLYYAPGTSIHDVWAPELNVFNTVENMEWSRIIRHKHHLRRRSDIHGRPMFTDEQMITYLKQFERDFASAEQRIIDTTEGGLPKLHTERMTFAEAIEAFATRDVPALPTASRELDIDRLRDAAALMQQRLDEVNELRRCCAKAAPLVAQMLESQSKPQKFNKLFDQLKKIQHRVHGELGETFSLVNELNVIGAFKRARADRAIANEQSDNVQKQAEQLRRDKENIDWLAQACDEALSIFEQARQRTEAALERASKHQQDDPTKITEKAKSAAA